MNNAEVFQRWIGQVLWSMLSEYWYAFAVLTIGAIYLFYGRRGNGDGGSAGGGTDLTGDDGDGGGDGGGDGRGD